MLIANDIIRVKIICSFLVEQLIIVGMVGRVCYLGKIRYLDKCILQYPMRRGRSEINNTNPNRCIHCNNILMSRIELQWNFNVIYHVIIKNFLVLREIFLCNIFDVRRVITIMVYYFFFNIFWFFEICYFWFLGYNINNYN